MNVNDVREVQEDGDRPPTPPKDSTRLIVTTCEIANQWFVEERRFIS